MEPRPNGTTTTPRVAAVIAHADDAALLERCIAHHLEIGVAHLFVSLNRADAASERVAREAARDRRVRVARVEDYSADPFRYFTEAVGVVRAWAAPDWLFFADSDEFWVPASGRIDRIERLHDTDVLSVPRYNAPPLRAAAGVDSLLRFDPYTVHLADPPGLGGPQSFERDPHASWVMLRDHPKVMVRPEFVAEVGRGAHTIVSNDPHWRGAQAADALIVHLPFTTRARFGRKLTAIRARLAAYGDRFGPGEAWHWRRWIALDDAGEIDAEFERQLLSEHDVERLRCAGMLTTPGEVLAGAKAACR